MHNTAGAVLQRLYAAAASEFAHRGSGAAEARAGREAAWREFLAHACGQFNAQCAGFMLINEVTRESDVVYAHGVSEQHRQRYRRRFAAINPRVPILLSMKVGEWFHCGQYFDDSFVDRDPYYQDFVIPSGMRYSLTGLVARREGVVITFGFWREKPAGAFSEGDLKRARELSRHLEAVADFHKRLARAEVAEESGRALAEAGSSAAWVVAGDGTVLARNAAAAGELAADCPVVLRDGRLAGRDRRNSTRFERGLEAALKQCTESARTLRAKQSAKRSSAAFRALPGKGRDRLALDVLTWTGEPSPWLAQAHTPAALVQLKADTPPVNLLAAVRRYRLSAAEAAVARSLCLGLSLAEIAASRGVSRSTVKTQVESLFVKTETRNQKALITTLLKS